MNAETEPENENRRAPLKLRPVVWRQLIFLLAFCGFQEWLFSHWSHRPVVPASLGGLLAYLGVVAYEWSVRPPVLRFWDDGSDYRLQVRRKANGAVLYRSEQDTLASTDFRSVDFAGCALQEIRASGSDFQGADLHGADLSGADLTSARLQAANLCGASLYRCRLKRAKLQGADLRGADFRGHGLFVTLSDDYLAEADFRGAFYNAATRWPMGFDPRRRGCVLVEEVHSDLPIPTQSVQAGAALLPIPRETLPPAPVEVEVQL